MPFINYTTLIFMMFGPFPPEHNTSLPLVCGPLNKNAGERDTMGGGGQYPLVLWNWKSKDICIEPLGCCWCYDNKMV